MPIYEYRCPRSHVTEQIRALEDHSEPCLCSQCGAFAEPIPSTPTFKLSWVRPVVDNGRAFEGTPLDGTDGANELAYKPKKIHMDMST